MKKVAMVGLIHQDGWKILEKKDYEIIEILDVSKDNLKKKLNDVDAIALRTAIIDNEILDQCKKLKIISRHGVGYNNVDLNYLNKNNQALAVTGTSNAVSVAEHVLTMFLYLAKRINKSDNLVKKGLFKKQSTLENFFELYKKTVLILGFGRIGQEVAKRCLGFDANVIVYDPFLDEKFIENKKCKKIEFEKGIKQADFITVHIPLNEKTKNIINKQQFLLMKENSIIVNTARGGIINENDLIWALENKKVLGAGLDVFEKEPPEDNHPIFKFDNVVLSPHNAALTLECRKRMAIETCENIVHYLEDKEKLNKNNIVNREILNL